MKCLESSVVVGAFFCEWTLLAKFPRFRIVNEPVLEVQDGVIATIYD